jgi:hypothetical protein
MTPRLTSQPFDPVTWQPSHANQRRRALARNSTTRSVAALVSGVKGLSAQLLIIQPTNPRLSVSESGVFVSASP